MKSYSICKRICICLLCLSLLLCSSALGVSAKEIAVNYTWYDFAGYTSTGTQVPLTYGQYTSAPNFMRFQNTDYYTDTGKYLDIYLEMESDIPEKAYLDFTVTLFLRTSQYTNWQPYVTASCYGSTTTGLLQEGTIVSGSYTGLTYKISLFAENGLYAGNATNTVTLRFGYTKSSGQGNFDIGYMINSFVVNTEDTVQDTVKDQTNAIGGWFAELGEKIGGWFTDLKDAISGFFDNLFEKIKGLFIPEEGFLEEFLTATNTWLHERLGGLMYPLDLVLYVFDKIQTYVPKDPVITFPEIKMGGVVIIEEMTYDFQFFDWPILYTLYAMYLTMVDCIVAYWLIKLALKVFNTMMRNN